MNLIRTARVKLNIAASEILPTISAYTKAFNFVCKTGYEQKTFNGVNLHHQTYQTVREYLPSQLAISSRVKATEAVKSVLSEKVKKKGKKLGECPQSKNCNIRLDANSYSLFLDKQEVSILTISGRKRCSFEVSDYYKKYFKDWTYSSAELIVRNNQVYLHVVFDKDVDKTPVSGKMLGIDRGINKLAVCSDNKFYTGEKVKQVSHKYRTLRETLGKVDTKSAKRHLKKLSSKERRFKADINHQISKAIVSSLNPGDTIVLEDLEGIRDHKLRKPMRILVATWSFYQLEQFLTYKGMAKGISIEHVNPRYTSQKCSKCGYTSRKNRITQSGFCCKECGFKLNADLNASRNICNKALERYTRSNGVAINQPIVPTEMLGTSPSL